MSSNTTPPTAFKANQTSPNKEGKKRTLEEENGAAKRHKTASVNGGGANDDEVAEIVDISFRSLEDIVPDFQNIGVCLKECMEKIIAQERANHEKDLEAEKKKTDVALNKLMKALEAQQAAREKQLEAEYRTKKFKEDLTELEDTNKKLQATNEKLKGDLVDANEKLAKLQGVKDELSGLKLNLVSLLEGHEATPSAAASGVASPVGAENGACTGAVAATVSPAASSPPAAMHQDKTQSTAVEWTAEKMRNLYYAVHSLSKPGISHDWEAISEVVLGDTNAKLTGVTRNKWYNSGSPGKATNPLEDAFIGEKVVVVHDSGNVQQEMIGEVVGCSKGTWNVHFDCGKNVQTWESEELLQGWRLYTDNF